jgi:predicted nucleic acid-binding protein
MYLVDTSVWIEVFRRGTSLDLESLLDIDEIVTCLPVIQEVLQGFREEAPYRLARESITSFPIVEAPMSLDVFLQAAELYRSARRSGLTVRSSTDCLIAACALRNDLSVLHRDRDFAILAKVSSLKAQNLK